MRSLRSSRSGIQMSVNMLVVIILGIVMLGLGIMLVTTMVSQGQEYTEEVDQQLMDRLRRSQFSDGRLVAVLSPQKEVGAGDFVEFVLGFRNNEDSPRDFSLVVEFNKDSSPVTDSLSWTSDHLLKAGKAPLYNDGVVALDPNDDHFEWIRVAPPKDLPSGQYFYDVYVCYDGSAYTDFNPPCPYGQKQLYSGSKQRLFVNVR